MRHFDKEKSILRIKALINAYQNGLLGDVSMPEDSHPDFDGEKELKLRYYTLPMALNYQRDSYKLWEAAKRTYEDGDSNVVYDISRVVKMGRDNIRPLLLKNKLALQPNKHIDTWYRISETVVKKWGNFNDFIIGKCESDFLSLKNIVQHEEKSGFPYLSGPKIFNYWSYILQRYCGIELQNAEHITIAPDTHVIQASVCLGLISSSDVNTMSREQISEKWKNFLSGTGIKPIDVHSPLWFWSRGGFKFNADSYEQDF